MASMNWLGFSLSSQELPSQPANQDHSRLSFNSDEISGTDASRECFYLTSDSTAHSLHLPPSFGIFEAFNRNNNYTQDWDIKGLGSNTENYKTASYLPMLRGTSCSSQNLDNNQLQPKLENFLGRHSYGDDDHVAYGNASTGDYMFPNCSIQAAETSADGGTSSSSSIGLSMIKTWLRNQPTQSDNNESGGNAATSGYNAQTLSLSMSTGSQSSSTLPLLTANVGGGSSSSDNKQSKTSTPLDTQTGATETVPRKSIDTFGQRTSIYRGVTRHRWTGRYEAHLWDNSCRREGQTRKGRQVYLGGYDKEEKAARAYDLAALKYWGTTTTTNFPISNYEKELEEMKHMTRQEYVASLRRKSSGFSRGASIYRGVTRHHQHGRWQARIGRVAGNKDLYLGTFSTQEEAAEAYDIAAIKFRGLNAVTNFDMSRYDVKSIIESSTLPIGGAAKRLKDAEHAEVSVDCERKDDHSMSSQLTDGINNYSWPALTFQQPQPQPYSLPYPYGQRLWCKQEQDSDTSHTFQDIHQLQLGNGNTHNFLHSNSLGSHSIMSVEYSHSASMDNSSGGGGGGEGSGYGYLLPMSTDGNQNQRSNGLGDTGYESVFGCTDPYHHHARNLYYISQQSSADAVKASTYDQGSACNTWVPSAIPTLAPRSTNMALCPGAPPFTLLHE